MYMCVCVCVGVCVTFSRWFIVSFPFPLLVNLESFVGSPSVISVMCVCDGCRLLLLVGVYISTNYLYWEEIGRMSRFY